MKKLTVWICFAFVLALVNGASAETDQSATPTSEGGMQVNEGVCDVLIGLTPGLYGLCVGFTQAQDCSGFIDPATGEIELNLSCTPSARRLLDTYDQLKTEDDPTMPGFNPESCPCWTEEEMDVFITDKVAACRHYSNDYQTRNMYVRVDSIYSVATHPVSDATTFLGSGKGGSPLCRYSDLRVFGQDESNVTRYMEITEQEYAACTASIVSECYDRGLSQ